MEDAEEAEEENADQRDDDGNEQRDGEAGADGGGDQRAESPDSHHKVEGGSPGKIFVGGLAKDTKLETFIKHFEAYGKIVDSVIMKDRRTGHPRGFGFITYADPAVVDKVILENHIINGKQVEIKRTIPKGAIPGARDFKTKKIFVGGIPTSVTEDEFKNFFSKFGEVKDHPIMKAHSTNRSRGFGFITFDTEEAVDELLAKGNRIEFAGVQVEIKKAQPKGSSAPPAPKTHFSSKKPAFSHGYGDYRGAYRSSSYGGGSRSAGGFDSRAGAYGGYRGSGFYEGYSSSGLGTYRGDPAALGYSPRYGGGGLGRGYSLGGYSGATEGYEGFGGSRPRDYGVGYGAGLGPAGYAGSAGYGDGYGSTGGSMYGSRGGYGGSGGRYHPYGR